MRDKIITLLQWIHCTFIGSAILALIWSVVAKEQSLPVYREFIFGFFLIIPVVCGYFMARYVKNFLLFMLLTAILVFGFYYTGFSYPFLVMSVLIIFNGYTVRDDKSKSFFFSPNIFVAGLFIFINLFSAFLDNDALMNISLYGLIGYLAFFIFYNGLNGITWFLTSHQNISNIPSDRIGKINSSLSGIYIGIFMAFFIPIIILLNGKINLLKPLIALLKMIIEFILPKETTPFEESFDDILSDVDFSASNESYMTDNIFMEILIILIHIVLVAIVIYLIYKKFLSIRNPISENGDKIEFLKRDQTEEKVKRQKTYIGLSFFNRSPNSIIRKSYIKMIRKATKELPKKHATPKEIEENAGIPDNNETQVLHDLYEKARYSENGCTKDDLTFLKNK